MSDPITVTNLTQVGRINAPDPNQPRVFITYNADFTANADITLDFTIVNQQQVYGIPRALFIDNGSNPNEVEVSISQTDMFFTIPAYAEGYFKLDAAQNSRINFVTTGGATDKVTITVYNYEIPPNVWYKFGAFDTGKPVKVEGTQPKGTDMDTADNNYPVYAAGADNAGILRPLLTDNTGRLIIVGSGAGGQVFGPDADGVPPTQPPVLNAGFDGVNVQTFLTDAGGRQSIKIEDGLDIAQGAVADAAVTNPAASGSVIALLKGLLTFLGFSSTSTRSSVAAAATDTLILAANANRKVATIYNDSVEILYLGLGTTAAATNNFTTQVAAGGYYEVPSKYTGQIRGIWAAASGNARVTEVA